MSEQSSNNNKRIAKNTLLLYFRMLFNLLVSLYTSRVILQALGVEDMGIYNVVGGIVTMSQVITSSISNAISRFLTFELGKGDMDKLRLTFSVSVTVLIILSFIIFVIAEFGGLYFVDNVLNISQERLAAAKYVLLFSILTFCVNMISVPYNASIISHENMNVYAYVGIFEVVMKLGIAYAIMQFSTFDRLILYAMFLFLLALIIRVFYGFYCSRTFAECRYSFIWNKKTLKELTEFASWSFLENLANVFKSQGVTMLVNIFFGVTINAAQAIANQVSNAIQQFSNNFITAVTPQIIKMYAEGKYDEMLNLTNKASRFSFYITILLAFPIVCNLSLILGLWLHEVPEYTDTFILLIVVWILFEVLSQPVLKVIVATGKIKQYQIGISIIMFSNFPLSWLALRCGCNPNAIYIVSALTCLLALLYRIWTLHKLLPLLSLLSFSRKLLLKPIIIFVISLCVYFLLHAFNESILLWSILCEIILFLIISFYGVSKNERLFVLNMMKSKFSK